MRHDRHRPYLAMGLTAFSVIAASLLLFFLLFQASAVMKFLNSLAFILRPIFMGAVLAFLLLPVHRNILKLLRANSRRNGLSQGVLNIIAIILSMVLAGTLRASRVGSSPFWRTTRRSRRRWSPPTIPPPGPWNSG